MKTEAVEGVECGPITRWIERYYEDKLDKRDKGPKGPGAYLGMKKRNKRDLMSMQALNN